VKATGIVRRIDELGRVVVPKEIRQTLKIREGDPIEIFVDHERGIILKKFSPIGELGRFVQDYADSLHKSLNHIICIADRDTVVAAAGAPKKEYLNKTLSPAVEGAMETRTSLLIQNTAEHPYYPKTEGERPSKFASEAIAPIIANGNPIGAVHVGVREENARMGNLELKMVETAASFLAKQVEL
jgi:AbrB family transcriptional regulator, stage V sporulation protein T